MATTLLWTSDEGVVDFRIRYVAYPNLSLIWRQTYCVCLFLSVMETLSKLWRGRVESGVCLSVVGCVFQVKGVWGFGSVCEISSSVDEVGVGFAVRVVSVW